MSPYVSQKIRHISLFLMVLVAAIHGYNVNLRFSNGVSVEAAYWLRFMEGFISDGICRVAVPMFFAISGFLAVFSLKAKLSVSSLLSLWKKRISSLLIPFLLVSALGIATVFVLQIIPFSRPFFNNYSIYKTTLAQWGKVFLIAPVPYQLWFIRFLLDYFLLFPVLFFLTRWFREGFLLLLFYFWSSPVQLEFVFLKPWISLFSYGAGSLVGMDWPQPMYPSKDELEGLFFFTLGMYFGFRPLKWLEIRLSPVLVWALVLAWLGWIAYRTTLALEPEKEHYAVHYNLIGFTFSGLFLFWFLYDFLISKLSGSAIFQSALGYTFGIFLFHEPFLTIVKKGMIWIGGGSDSTLFVAFWLSPVLALWYSYVFSKVLRKWLPGAYSLVTGNRLPPS